MTPSAASDAVSDGANYGRLKTRVEPNGFWQQFEYNDAGGITKTVSPFGNSAVGASTGVRVHQAIYSTVAPQRTEIEKVILSSGATFEVGRNYTVIDSGLGRRIVSQTAGAAFDAPDNLVTTTRYLVSGTFSGRVLLDVRPDGTGIINSYSVSGNNVTTTTFEGAFNSSQSAIIAGTRTVRVTNDKGEIVSQTETDIATGLPLSAKTATQFDDLARITRYDYASGESEVRAYSCCGLEYVIGRDGVQTTYVYDEWGRVEFESRNGITLRYTYDAAGRRNGTYRNGTGGIEVPIETIMYDAVGEITSSTAFGLRTTTFSRSHDALGRTLRTTAAPDGGTRIETHARDGSLVSIEGTAAHPKFYEYGVDAAGQWVKETSVGAVGETGEWVKTHTDFAGRSYKTEYPDGATQQRYFDAVGRVVREVDPDGVVTLYTYSLLGEREVTARDVDGNGTIDYAGLDRITRTTRSVASKTEGSVAYTVIRTIAELWETDNQDTPVTVSVVEQSSDGLRSWQTVRGRTTSSVTTLDGTGGRTITTTTPDGVKTVHVYSGGRLVSNTVKTAADVQLAAATYAYDPHGRMQSTTDARNGATTFTYHADDQLHTVTTPDPDTTKSGPGYDPQTTTYTYDSVGRVKTVTHPDGGMVTTTYWPTGAVKRTSGTRTYPVEYTYDSQGRVKTLTTWQNFAGDTGKAVTTWNYHAQRGWLENKRYPDNAGPSYTYKPSGRLLTRTWARTPAITTTYSYNAAGDLSGTDYSDTTPDVTLLYDRAGRPKTLTDGSGARTLGYHASGQLEDETYTSGLLNGLAVDRSFDSLHRLSSLAMLATGYSLPATSYAYDAASRLDTITAGANTTTYAYHANSPLVSTLTFKNAGTARLTTTKSYDKLNRLGSISSAPSASSAVNYSYTYNSANQRTRVTREDNAYWNWTYDWLGQVTSAKKYLDGAVPALGQDYTWTFDDIGNRKTATTNGASATYTANTLNQYLERTVPGTIDVLGAADSGATVTVAVNSGTPQPTTRQGEAFYKQLSVNNASAPQNASLKITGVKNLVGPNGEDAVTEITKAAFVAQPPEAFTHDLDGNLTLDARWSYSWDAENRLIAMETTPSAATAGVAKQKLELGYDGQSRRVSKKVFNWNGSTWTLTSHTLFVYDGWNLLAELNALSSNAAVRTYAWGLDLSGSLQGAGGVGGLLSVTYHSSPATHHFCAFDGNGNVGALVNASDGTVSARYDYNAFGELIQIDGPAAEANPFRFSTKYADVETGLLYYGYRYYEPSTARWPNRDPIDEQGGINLYGMLDNNLNSRWDFLGLSFTGDLIEVLTRPERYLIKKAETYLKQNPMLRNVLMAGELGRYIGDGIDHQLVFRNFVRGLNLSLGDVKKVENWLISKDIASLRHASARDVDLALYCLGFTNKTGYATLQALSRMLTGIEYGAINFAKDKVIGFFSTRLKNKLFPNKVEIPKNQEELFEDWAKFVYERMEQEIRTVTTLK
jgi:RHS repeat-associated protein